MGHLTPLLLLPGIMNDARVWHPVEEALPRGRKVVVGNTHLHDHVSAIAAAAIESMPPGKFAVGGFSLGGYVALEVCRQAPDRIAGVALLDTGARADTEESRQNRSKTLASLASGEATFDEVAGAFPPKLLHPSHVNDSALVALLLDMAKRTGREGFMRQQQAAMSRPDNRDVLRTLQGPALVLCGQDDQVTPPALSQEMAELLPGDVTLVLVPQCGHLSTLEQPAAVVAAFVPWIERVDNA